MPENNHPVPSLARLVRKALATCFGALENRGELFMLEAQEERRRLILLVLFCVGAAFLAMVGVLLLTGTILFLIPEHYRVYAAGAFTLVYFAGSAAALFALRMLLKETPFSESLAQFRKDRELLDAFK